MNTTKNPGMTETVKDDGLDVVARTDKIIGATMDVTAKVLNITLKDGHRCQIMTEALARLGHLNNWLFRGSSSATQRTSSQFLSSS